MTPISNNKILVSSNDDNTTVMQEFGKLFVMEISINSIFSYRVCVENNRRYGGI